MENSATKVRFDDEVRYKNSSRLEADLDMADQLELEKQKEDYGFYLLRSNYKVKLPITILITVYGRKMGWIII